MSAAEGASGPLKSPQQSLEQEPAAVNGSALGLYVIVVLVWGSSWIGLRLQGNLVAPEVSVFWRFLIACPVMFAWAALARQRLDFVASAHLLFAGMGACMFSLNIVLFYSASQAIPTGLMAVVFSLASLYNLILNALAFRQRIEPTLALAGLVGVAGVALMFAPEIIDREIDRAAAFGLAQCVAATVLFCTGNVISAISQRRGQPVLAASAWGMLYGTAIVLALSLMQGHAFIVEWTVRYLGSLVWLALVASVLAFWAFLTLVGRTGAARAGYVTVLFPVVALAISTVVEGYRWTPMAGLGLALVIAGNVLVLRGSRR